MEQPADVFNAVIETLIKNNCEIPAFSTLERLIDDCNKISAYSNKNYFPLLWSGFKSHRKILFEMIKLIPIISTTQDNLIIDASNYLLKCENSKSDFIDAEIDISFASEKW